MAKTKVKTVKEEDSDPTPTLPPDPTHPKPPSS